MSGADSVAPDIIYVSYDEHDVYRADKSIDYFTGDNLEPGERIAKYMLVATGVVKTVTETSFVAD